MKKFILSLFMVGFSHLLIAQNCQFDYIPKQFIKNKLNVIIPTYEEHLEELKTTYQQRSCNHDTLPVEWYTKRKTWEKERAKSIQKLNKILDNPIIYTKATFEALKNQDTLENQTALYFTFSIAKSSPGCIDGGWIFSYSYQFVDLTNTLSYKLIGTEECDPQIFKCIWNDNKNIFQILEEYGS